MIFKVLEKQLVSLSRLNIWVTSLFILLIYLANLFFIDDAKVDFILPLNNHKFKFSGYPLIFSLCIISEFVLILRVFFSSFKPPELSSPKF